MTAMQTLRAGGAGGPLPPPVSTGDLLLSERRFVTAMQELGFGRFELVPIRDGQVVLDPWPTTVRGIKFGSESSPTAGTSDDFQLKRQVVELFQYVRAVGAGQIRCLEVRHGLPFSMEVEDQPSPDRGHRG